MIKTTFIIPQGIFRGIARKQPIGVSNGCEKINAVGIESDVHISKDGKDSIG